MGRLGAVAFGGNHAHTVDLRRVDLLEKVFEKFDADGTGYIEYHREQVHGRRPGKSKGALDSGGVGVGSQK